MNALYAIEDFGLTTLTDQLIEMYEKKIVQRLKKSNFKDFS